MNGVNRDNDAARHCAGCTACCRWPGVVTFPADAVGPIAAHLGMDERACADLFFELADNRRQLRTKKTTDGGCIFIGETGCRIYPHRPRQCRTFPYEWQRPEAAYMAQCPLHKALKSIA